jgi:hypothetical protein
MENVGILLLYSVYFTVIWHILCPYGTFYVHLVDFMVNGYISGRFGTLRQEKSGNLSISTT